MKIRIKHAMLLAVSIVWVVILVGCGNDNELTIDQVDVMAKVMADGDLYVEELFTYTVQGEYERIPRYMDNFGERILNFLKLMYHRMTESSVILDMLIWSVIRSI